MTATSSLATGLWSAWREAFDAEIRAPELATPLKEASLAGRLGNWTTSLTRGVVQACRHAGWEAAAKGFPCNRLPTPGQEYLGIDVMALPPSTENLPTWPSPLAVFELENSKSEARIAYSLWKVLNLRAPLRVVFAYRPDWQQGSELVANLATGIIWPMSPHERMAIAGDTIVVVGNRGEGETFPWGYFKAWRLDANVGRFEKI